MPLLSPSNRAVCSNHPLGRILFIAPTLEGGGSGRVLLNVAELFSSLGYEAHVLVLKDMIDFDVDERIRLRVLSIPEPISKHKLLQHLIFTVFLKNYLRSQGPFDLILSNYQSRYQFYPDTVAERIFFWIHADYWSDIAALLPTQPDKAQRETKRIKQFYDQRHLIAVSEAAKCSLLEGNKVEPKTCRVIYNPFDFAKIKAMATERTGNLPTEDYIIHVAKFDRYKRHDLLLDAFRQIAPPIKLVLLTKEHDGLISLIDQFGLRDRVIVARFQKNPYPWIRQAKLLVLSSDSREALPTVLIEALILGTPVVSTDCPTGPREILAGSLAQWLVPVNDSRMMATTMQQALAGDYRIEEQLLERFSSKVVMQQFLELLQA